MNDLFVLAFAVGLGYTFGKVVAVHVSKALDLIGELVANQIRYRYHQHMYQRLLKQVHELTEAMSVQEDEP